MKDTVNISTEQSPDNGCLPNLVFLSSHNKSTRLPWIEHVQSPQSRGDALCITASNAPTFHPSRTKQAKSRLLVAKYEVTVILSKSRRCSSGAVPCTTCIFFRTWLPCSSSSLEKENRLVSRAIWPPSTARSHRNCICRNQWQLYYRLATRNCFVFYNKVRKRSILNRRSGGCRVTMEKPSLALSSYTVLLYLVLVRLFHPPHHPPHYQIVLLWRYGYGCIGISLHSSSNH